MKKIFFGLLMTSILTICSCSKEDLSEITIKRDCTGTYLRINNLDFHVCNFELLSEYPTDSKINIFFKPLEKCYLDTVDVCALYHPNEGWIHVSKIFK